jgi:AcrR family transcriptional regulator
MQNAIPERASQAAGRKLADRQQAATAEVERILAAGLRVMEQAYPDSPRVVDIVAEAGTSNQTFYSYFASKNELTLAIMDRGIRRLVTYLEHQMGKEPDPRRQIARWIEGVLAQVADPSAARASLAVITELGRVVGPLAADGHRIVASLRDLLLPPLEEAGSREIARDADAIYEVGFGTMRRHLFNGTRPPRAEVRHLVQFCLAGMGAPPG